MKKLLKLKTPLTRGEMKRINGGSSFTCGGFGAQCVPGSCCPNYICYKCGTATYGNCLPPCPTCPGCP